ncbi:MAG: DUF1080 domain-containing protein [Sedimentisphaerales bacterium]|nr:DUF1080 domain-containing protein [Sedimentisphaerales bacterium]
MTRQSFAARILAAALGITFAVSGSARAVKNGFYSSTVDIGIVVSDVEKSVAFYRDALGFTQMPGFDVSPEMAGQSGLTDSAPFQVRVMVLGGEDTATKIKLMQIPQGANKKVDNRFINSSLGLSYLTILVEDTGKALDRCRRAGVEPIKTPYRLADPMKYLTLVRDPDGNLIELVEPGPPTPFFVHGDDRKAPPLIQPPDGAGKPPSDAIVLFDGTDFKEWQSDKAGQPVRWKIQDGYMEVAKDAGGIHTQRQFGSCQLHIEWATPAEVDPKKTGQSRGNSGVFFMGRYELQVLDSYNNPTYGDGQAASVYGQVPPFVNVCKKPGEWQSYDVAFLQPLYNEQGLLIRPGRITVYHNGVCVHNNYTIRGTTNHKQIARYGPPQDKGPISLQDHGNPMRFRNIWIRPLPEEVPSSQLPPAPPAP